MSGVALPTAPRWHADVARRACNEARLYLRTWAATALHPGAFVIDWAESRRKLMNPAAFMATSVAIVAPLAHAVQRYWDAKTPDSLWIDIAQTVAPFVQYIVIAVVCHGVLRLCGSRQLLRGSVAIGLYSGGSVGAASHLALLPIGLIAARLGLRAGSELPTWLLVPLLVVGFGGWAAFSWHLMRSLRVLHGARWRWILLALVVAYVADGALVGRLHLTGSFFGGHLAIGGS
jgi:hypothetical protein